MQSASKRLPSLFSKQCFVKISDMSKNPFHTTLALSGQSLLSLFVVMFPSKREQLFRHSSPHHLPPVRQMASDWLGCQALPETRGRNLSCFECHRSVFVLDCASSASCPLAGGFIDFIAEFMCHRIKRSARCLLESNKDKSAFGTLIKPWMPSEITLPFFSIHRQHLAMEWPLVCLHCKRFTTPVACIGPGQRLAYRQTQMPGELPLLWANACGF